MGCLDDLLADLLEARARDVAQEVTLLDLSPGAASQSLFSPMSTQDGDELGENGV